MQPFHLDGPSGRLFAIYHAPAGPDRDPDSGANVIVVPPFAEEMNRSRRMMALQARALAAAGVGCLLLDLYGTGDSGGDFGDARWNAWRDDIHAAARWLAARSRPAPHLLGIRLGGTLAAACRRDRPEAYGRLVLWQPVANGETFLTQFLRIVTAATMAGDRGAGDGGPQTTTKALRQRLRAGGTVEVAGYLLHPELAGAIDALRLADLIEPAGDPAGDPVAWLELAGEADRPLPPGSRAVIEALRGRGVAIEEAVIAGEPFWARLETTVAPALIAATARALAP